MKPAFQSNKGLLLVIIRNIFFGINGSIVAIAMKHIIDGASTSDYTNVWNWLIIMTIFYLIQDIPSYFFRNAWNKWFWDMRVYLYQKYMKFFFTADSNTIEWLWTGKIQSIIFTWCNARQNTLNSLQAWIRMMIGIVLWFLLIGNSLWRKWFIVVLAVFIWSYIFVQYWNKILAWYRKEKRDLFTESDKRLVRMIMSKNEVLQNNKVSEEIHFIKSHYDRIYTIRLKESKKQVLTFDLQKFTFTIIRIWILAYTLYWIQKWLYSIWTLWLLWMLVNQVYSNIQDLNSNITQFHTDKVNIDKLRDLFKDTPQIKWYDTGKVFTPTQGDILLDNVTYDYGKWEVIHDFSLHIQWWKKTALIWVSWGGKSTIIKLVAGYLYPQTGSVKIDWQELPNPTNTDYVSLQSYYKHIGYLTQEPSVFDGTIYENLTYALDHKPSEQEIQDAIQWAQCQFINEFPEWVQTQIWEKWIKLSGWQRQRLAIAKVLLKNPKIILLDEPTSALDSFSEEEVSKAFNNLFVSRTVIIIAHRLQTVKHADSIIVLEKWKVVEEWNHTSLVASGWVYAKMLELQSGF
jgi:ABC-type multidrug transport system fused ATPase/permease subunit